VIIRRAVAADLPAIMDIYNQAVLNTTATYAYEPQTLEERAAWFEEHARDGYPVFVAQEESGRVIGWSALSRFRARAGYRFTAEDSIYVAADQRGRGVGKQLLPPVIEAARGLGLHALIAGIDAEGEASLRLHARFGFQPVAHFKQVGFKFGRWLDVIMMELLLPEYAPFG